MPKGPLSRLSQTVVEGHGIHQESPSGDDLELLVRSGIELGFESGPVHAGAGILRVPISLRHSGLGPAERQDHGFAAPFDASLSQYRLFQESGQHG